MNVGRFVILQEYINLADKCIFLSQIVLFMTVLRNVYRCGSQHRGTHVCAGPIRQGDGSRPSSSQKPVESQRLL